VAAYVGRLDEQKGMHLVHHAVIYTLARGGQFVLIGDAHHQDGINSHFWHLKEYLNDNPACESALGRALRLWSTRPGDFRRLVASCMRADYSWARPGQEYLDIYHHIRHR
jgi:glycogen synthase